MSIEIKQEIKIKLGDQEFTLTKEEAKLIRDELNKILGHNTNNLREIEKYITRSPNNRDNDLWPLPKTPHYPSNPAYPNLPEVWCESKTNQ